MATGQEILSYKGDANLALGSSQLPASSSVYVSDFDKAFNFWQNYAQRKFLADKAKFDQNNLERAANQKRLEDAINLGNYNIWQDDKDDFLNNYYNPLADLLRKNPTAVDPNSPDYFKFNELLGRAKQAAAFSTQQKAEYDTGYKFERENPDLIRNIGASEQYRTAGSIMDRANMGGINFQPKFDINPYADQDKLIKLIQYDNPDLQVTKGKFGNDLYTITQNPNLDKAREAIRAEYTGNINNQRAIQQMINDDPSVMDGFQNPQDLYESIRISALPLDEKTKVELRGRSYPPASLTKPPEGSDQVYLNELIRRGQNGDEAALQAISGTLDGHLIKKVEYVSTTDVPALTKKKNTKYADLNATKDPDEKKKIQGEIDVLEEQISNSAGQPKSIKITFADTQTPLKFPIDEGSYYTLNNLYRKVEKENNVRIQDVTGDIFSKPQTTNKSEKAVTSKQDKTYDATTEAGIKAMMKANPKLSRQQIIDALIKSGRITE